MKESKAVYVTKRDIRENLLYRDYQLNSTEVYNDKYHLKNDIGIQYNSKKDNIYVIHKNFTSPRRYRDHNLRYFSPIPKEFFPYIRSKSFTDIGVGSVKALQKKKVKKIYLPETVDRGIGSSDLTSFITRMQTLQNKSKASKQYRPVQSYYETKRTSSKCIGGSVDWRPECLVNARVSPIVHTKSAFTSPEIEAGPSESPLESCGVETVEAEVKTFVTTDTQFEEMELEVPIEKTKKIPEPKKQEYIQKTSKKSNEAIIAAFEFKPTKDELFKQSITMSTKPSLSKSSERKSNVERSSNTEKKSETTEPLEGSFSSDSLVQHVHNLEQPSEYNKQKDPMENKMEREYRKIFASMSKDQKVEDAPEKQMPQKSTSLFRRRFTAIRKSLGKRDSKNPIGTNKSSVPSVKDASITSDPPSLEEKSFSSLEAVTPNKRKTPRKMSSYKKSYTSKKNSKIISKANVIDNECDQGVIGMFKIWGRKFNLEDDTYVKKDENHPSSFEDNPQEMEENALEWRPKPASMILPEKAEGDVLEKDKEKKEGKKFLFFKKKYSKDKTKTHNQTYKNKKGVTAGRCEVKDGLSIKMGARTPIPVKSKLSTAPTSVKKKKSTPADNYDEPSRSAWLMKYLKNPTESRNSVKIRWNNKTYTASSSTVFELMSSVYKNSGVVLKSNSDIITDMTTSWSSNLPKANFVQKIEAWMVPKTIPNHAPPVIFYNISDLCNKSKGKRETHDKKIDVRISDQKMTNYKPNVRANKLEMVLHSKNFVKLHKQEINAEYLRIDMPVGYFDDYSSDEPQPEQTSVEKICNIVEYESINYSPQQMDTRCQDSGDEEEGIQFENKKFESPSRSPLDRRFSKSNKTRAGIKTQKESYVKRRPIIGAVDYLSEEETDQSQQSHFMQQSDLAKIYLLKSYHHRQPPELKEFFSCRSDSHMQCCTGHNSWDSYYKGDTTKSCPNIFSEYVSMVCSYFLFFGNCIDKKNNKKEKKENKQKKPKQTDSEEIPRVLPKDSREVFRKRKIYAQEKSNWIDNESADTVMQEKNNDLKEPTCKKVKILPEPCVISDRPCCTKNTCGQSKGICHKFKDLDNVPSNPMPGPTSLAYKSHRPKIDQPKPCPAFIPIHAEPPQTPPLELKDICQSPQRSSPASKCLKPCCTKSPPKNAPKNAETHSPTTPTSPPTQTLKPQTHPNNRPIPPSCHYNCDNDNYKDPSDFCSRYQSQTFMYTHTPSSHRSCQTRDGSSSSTSPCTSINCQEENCKFRTAPLKKPPIKDTIILRRQHPPTNETQTLSESSPSCQNSPVNVCDPQKGRRCVTGVKLSNADCVNFPEPQTHGIQRCPLCPNDICLPHCPNKKIVIPPAQYSTVIKNCPTKSKPCPHKIPHCPSVPKSPNNIQKCPDIPKSPTCPNKTQMCANKPKSPPRLSKSPPHLPKSSPPKSPPYPPKTAPCLPKSSPPKSPPCQPKSPDTETSPSPPKTAQCTSRRPPTPPQIPPSPPRTPPCPPCGESPASPKQSPLPPDKRCPHGFKISNTDCERFGGPRKPNAKNKQGSAVCCDTYSQTEENGSAECCKNQPCKVNTMECKIPLDDTLSKCLSPIGSLMNQDCTSSSVVEKLSSQLFYDQLDSDQDFQNPVLKCTSTPRLIRECYQPERLPKSQPNLRKGMVGIFLKKYGYSRKFEKPNLDFKENITFEIKDDDNDDDVNKRKGCQKILDDDDITLVERKDYRKSKNALITNIYNHDSTRLSAPITVNNVSSVERKNKLDQSRSTDSIANMIEINFKLRVMQGEKTADINIGNKDFNNVTDNTKEKNSRRKLDHSDNRAKEVYIFENGKAIDNTKQNNDDLNIRILIKNYKTKSEPTEGKQTVDFPQEISKKFNTVSTGYSVDFKSEYPDDTCFSVHRATIDLTSEYISSKDNIFVKEKRKENQFIYKGNKGLDTDEVLSQSIKEKMVGENLSSAPNVDSTSCVSDVIANNSMSSKSDGLFRKNRSSKKSSLLSISQKKSDKDNTRAHKMFDRFESVNINESVKVIKATGTFESEACLSLTDTDDRDISFGNKTSDEATDLLLKTSEERTDTGNKSSRDSTDHTDLEKNSEDSDTKSSDIVEEKIPKEEVDVIDFERSKKEQKKVMLKQVFDHASLNKPKTKSRLQKIKDLLKVILTSDDGSESECEKNCNEESKEESKKPSPRWTPNVKHNSDSLNNYFEGGSMMVSQNALCVNTVNSYQSNVIMDSGDEENSKTGTCLCSNFAAKLKLAGGGCCCRRIPEKNSKQVSCDFINELSLKDFSYFAPSVECVHCQTNNSRYRSSIHCSKIISMSSKNTSIITPQSRKSSFINPSSQNSSFLTRSRGEPDHSEVEHQHMKSSESHKSDLTDYEGHLLHVDESPEIAESSKSSVKLSKKGSIARDDQDKFGSKTKSLTKRISKKKHRTKIQNQSDILQMYETKKAVLEIYAEKIVKDDHERLVAKLPKFVRNTEHQLYDSFEQLLERSSYESSYEKVYKKSFVIMRVGQ